MDLPPRCAVFARLAFHSYDSMSDALKLLLAFPGREIVEDKHCAFLTREKLLKPQDLAAIADRGLRQDLQFRYGIQGDASGVNPLHFRADPLNRFAELDIRGVQNSVIGFFREPFRDAVEFH